MPLPQINIPKINLPNVNLGNQGAIGLASEFFMPGTGILVGSASSFIPETSQPNFFQNIGNSISSLFSGKPGGPADPQAANKNGAAFQDDTTKYYIIAGVVLLIVVIAIMVIRNRKP